MRGRGDGVDGVGPVGEGAAGSGLEEEGERGPAKGGRSDHLERGGSSAIGEPEWECTYGHMSSSDSVDTGAGD